MRALLLVLCGWVAAPVVGAVTFHEDFATDPSQHGWAWFGEAALFQWNATNQNLEVTWDSSKSNSFFHHPLGTILAKDDDFQLAFDLRLDEVVPGANPAKPSTFQLAIGFVNFGQAASTNFLRGSGSGSPNLVELDYFPDSGFGATVWPTFVASNRVFNYNGSDDYTIIELTTGDWFRVAMTYTASNRTLDTSMTRNGLPFGPINSVPLSPSFTDYRVDTVAICSYSDAGQTPPEFAGSLFARGVVDNFVVTVPDPPFSQPHGTLTNQVWQMGFGARTNWTYLLERSTNLQSWAPASPETTGTGGSLLLMDTNTPTDKSFYRVRAQRP